MKASLGLLGDGPIHSSASMQAIALPITVVITINTMTPDLHANHLRSVLKLALVMSLALGLSG